MADIVADELRKFIQTCLSNIEDDESIASMSFEDCERCLKLMLAR